MINFARFIHRQMDGVFPHGASKDRSAVRCTEAEAEQARIFLQVSGPGYTCDHLPYLDSLPVMMIANLALRHQFSLPSNNANGSVTRCDTIDYILILPCQQNNICPLVLFDFRNPSRRRPISRNVLFQNNILPILYTNEEAVLFSVEYHSMIP